MKTMTTKNAPAATGAAEKRDEQMGAATPKRSVAHRTRLRGEWQTPRPVPKPIPVPSLARGIVYRLRLKHSKSGRGMGPKRGSILAREKLERRVEYLGSQKCAAGPLYLFLDLDSQSRIAYTNRDWVDVEVGVGA